MTGVTVGLSLGALRVLAILWLFFGLTLAGCERVGLGAERVPGAPGHRDQPPAPTATVGPASTAPSPEIARLEQAVTERINQARQEHGLEPLKTNDTLVRVARDYSCLMAREDFFSHTGPAGQQVDDRVREAGVRYLLVGENLAKTVNAPNPVDIAVNGWLESPGHRANILREQFTETGVGICREGNTLLFTQIFLRPFPF